MKGSDRIVVHVGLAYDGSQGPSTAVQTTHHNSPFVNTLLPHLANSSIHTHHPHDPFRRGTDQSQLQKMSTSLFLRLHFLICYYWLDSIYINPCVCYIV